MLVTIALQRPERKFIRFWDRACQLPCGIQIIKLVACVILLCHSGLIAKTTNSTRDSRMIALNCSGNQQPATEQIWVTIMQRFLEGEICIKNLSIAL